MTVRIVTVCDESLDKCVLITGFPGIGYTGYIALKYMVDKLPTKLIGYIESNWMMPIVYMQNDRINCPFEIRKYKNLVFIKVEFPIHPSERFEFAKEISQWTVENNFSEAVLIGGLASEYKSENDEMRCAFTQSFKNRLSKFNIPTINRGLYIAGPLALLLFFYEVLNFPAIAILPYASKRHADPVAAALAVKKISSVYNLSLSVQELLDEAAIIEKEALELLRRQQESINEQRRSLYI